MSRTQNKNRFDPVEPNGMNSLSIEPLSLDRAAGTQIFNTLKLAILRLDLQPGQLISEADIAARFGASRTPVREAFLQLRGAGMIVTRPSRGNFVTKLSEKRIRESRFVREAIELAVINHLCANGLSAENKQKLMDILDQQRDVLETGRAIQFQTLDDLFHVTLAASTDFPRVAELLEQEKMHLDRLRVFSLTHQPHKEVLYDEHKQILEAIIAKDQTQAMQIMRKHLSAILETLAVMAEEHSEYFE